jgi:hypothetical protein
VLVLDSCTLTPNKDAGSLVIFNTLLLLREMGFQVTFIAEENLLYMPEEVQELQRAGIEVLYSPFVKSVEEHVKEFGKRYHLVLLVRPLVAQRQIKSIRRYCTNAKVLFHTVDLHYVRMMRDAEINKDEISRRLANEMKEVEFDIVRAADATIVVSTAELEILNKELPFHKVHVFPLILDVKIKSVDFKDRKDIVFLGGYQHKPNVDAVKYFVAEIMPFIRQYLPGVIFNVIGSNPTNEILALESEDVRISGFVDELTACLDRMRVSVAPLRYGLELKAKLEQQWPWVCRWWRRLLLLRVCH